jgi:hypothetical protein
MLALAPAAEGRGLKLGLMDTTQFQSSDPALRSLWLGRASGLGANLVILPVAWVSLASGPRDKNTDPTDPADPLYAGFGPLDAAVRSTIAADLTPIIQLRDAPTWAEGPNQPGPDASPTFTWKPSPAKFGQFARAITRRYSGRFRGLPAVRYWIPWGEPNHPFSLTPQAWHGKPYSPSHYRRMLNAFYAAAHRVSDANRVIAGSLAPYGVPWRKSLVMQPAFFWRKLLCLTPNLHRRKCRNPAHFDIAAHNPINYGPPFLRAQNRDDISTPDMGKLSRILRAARRLGTLRPRKPKPLWATEIFWESQPDLEDGLPLGLQARWLSQSFYILWRQGVSAVIWVQIVDQPLVAGEYTLQSGLYFNENYRDGEPKPARDAFRFPFTGLRLGTGRVRVWGKAPSRGRVLVQRRTREGWTTVRNLSSTRDRVFTGTISLPRHNKLRAVAGGVESLGWES